MPKKRLIVDDEIDYLNLLTVRLKSAGYEVLKATDGKQALLVIEKEDPDFVLLDITMPGMGGLETIKRMKENKYMSNIPALFLTARDSIDDKIEGLKLGVYDYITKPIDDRELLAKIEAVLRIQERYKEIAFRDDLTSLYNYNYFRLQLEQSFNHARRHHNIFSLLMLDIDDFKKINDAYGHLCGNLVLEKVGNTLKEASRGTDIISRYGGDEFAIILPETNNDQAHIVLDKLQEKIKGISIDYSGKNIEVSASFGFSTFSEDIKTKEMLLEYADKDLYRNKNKSSGTIHKETP